jgi:hypothetical protein
MKTLVIHPYDPTTIFLEQVYEGKDWTIITENASKRLIFESLKSHDRIIMMGHGTPNGLLGYGRFIIDPKWVYLLREKYTVSIWCNADEFVLKYDLKGFYTGMIISELQEANYLNVPANIAEIDESNVLFTDTITKHIEDMTKVDDIIADYAQAKSNVIDYNKVRIYHT